MTGTALSYTHRMVPSWLTIRYSLTNGSALAAASQCSFRTRSRSSGCSSLENSSESLRTLSGAIPSTVPLRMLRSLMSTGMPGAER